MPWCDECAKYWTPASMNEDGSCPRCGTDLELPSARAVTLDADGRPLETADGRPDGPAGDGPAGDDEGVPWHFKLLIVLLVIYLVYRFIEIGIKIFT